MANRSIARAAAWLAAAAQLAGCKDPIPIGAGVGATTGDFPTPPQPGPLNNSDTPNPCVASGNDGNADPQGGTDCDNKCFSEYDAATSACAKIASDVDRKACQDNAYAALQQCQTACGDASPSTKECDKKYQNCINNGPTSCLKSSGGKTLCQRCWERCNAGDSPSSQCVQCLF